MFGKLITSVLEKMFLQNEAERVYNTKAHLHISTEK